MVDINWDEAPEGTTHVVIPGITRHPWRKVDVANDKVYTWVTKEKDGYEGEWSDRHVESVEAYLGVNNNLLVERPVVEAELPNGFHWVEGATHYYPPAECFFNQDKPSYRLGGVWFKCAENLVKEYIGRDETIARFQGAKPKAPIEAPVKKKPVGWWN